MTRLEELQQIRDNFMGAIFDVFRNDSQKNAELLIRLSKKLERVEMEYQILQRQLYRQ